MTVGFAIAIGWIFASELLPAPVRMWSPLTLVGFAIAFVVLAVWLNKRYGWTAARWYRFRKAQLESNETWTPIPSNERRLGKMARSTAIELSRRGFSDLGCYTLDYYREFWMPMAGAAQLLISDDRQVLAYVVHIRLNSWLLRALNRLGRGRSSETLFISVLEDNRWLYTIIKSRLQIAVVMPPGTLLAEVPPQDFSGLPWHPPPTDRRGRLQWREDSGNADNR